MAQDDPRDFRRCLTIDEAAHALGIGRSLAYLLVARGELVAIKLGKRRLVPIRAIDELVARRMADVSESS